MAKKWEQVLEDAAAYPVLVTDASAPGASRGGPADDTQRAVDNALRSVLGGRTRADDPDGLKAALARSFVEDRVEGRRIYRNVPRGSIADTVGEGEVSGFQGALMAHAREVVDHGLPLLDGLRSLNHAVDEDDVSARAAIVRSNVMRLRDEFGRRDEPRPAVIEDLLAILLGRVPLGKVPETDLDKIGGVVGALRDELELTPGKYVKSIEDEHQLTNYRLLAEYVVGLRTAWETARPIFGAAPGKTAFVSAKLRHVELMMQTITESLDQVRAAMDSVFVGEAERRIQQIKPNPLRNIPRMTVEELLEWVEETVSPDNVTLIREGGRAAITESLVPTVEKLWDVLSDVANDKARPGGLGTPRVVKSLEELQAQWNNLTVELESLANITIPNQPDAIGIPGNFGHYLHTDNWEPDRDEVQMVFDRSTQRWTRTIDLAPGDYEFKIAVNRSWHENYGERGRNSRENFKLKHPGGPVTIEFDHTTKTTTL